MLPPPSVLVKPSVDWMMPTCIGEGRGIFFTQATDLNANFFQKHPHRHTQEECFTSYLGVP